jgi:hypothetical protein
MRKKVTAVLLASAFGLAVPAAADSPRADGAGHFKGSSTPLANQLSRLASQVRAIEVENADLEAQVADLRQRLAECDADNPPPPLDLARIAEGAVMLAGPLGNQLTNLALRVSAIEVENIDLAAQVPDLEQQLAECEGGNPPPSPDLPVLKEDPATNPDPIPLWGEISAASSSRHTWVASGAYDGGPYRRMTVLDGDDYYGERAELGYNSWTSTGRTFYLFKEGMQRVTDYWMRLPSNFPVNARTWQVVTQMKQTAPAAGQGGSPILALEVVHGEWRLNSSYVGGTLWSTPARTGQWTHIRWDVEYSVDPTKGTVQLTIGDAASPVIRTRTLKAEVGLGGYGIPVGSAIPSHLRLGIYHDPALPGTSVEFTDVRERWQDPAR